MSYLKYFLSLFWPFWQILVFREALRFVAYYELQTAVARKGFSKQKIKIMKLSFLFSSLITFKELPDQRRMGPGLEIMNWTLIVFRILHQKETYSACLLMQRT